MRKRKYAGVAGILAVSCGFLILFLVSCGRSQNDTNQGSGTGQTNQGSGTGQTNQGNGTGQTDQGSGTGQSSTSGEDVVQGSGGEKGTTPVGTWYEQAEAAARLVISDSTISYYSGYSDYTEETFYTVTEADNPWEKGLLRLSPGEVGRSAIRRQPARSRPARPNGLLCL